MNNIPSCKTGDTYIIINGIKNTLTCKEWKYYNGETYCPTFTEEEKHFLSNLFCGEIRKKLIYSAQQGTHKVYRVKVE